MKEELNIIFIEEDLHDSDVIFRQIDKEEIIYNKLLVRDRDKYIEALKNSNPDLIISGYMLSGLNGMESIAIRNELAPAIPFILVTGLVNENVAIDCMKAGADDYLMKRNLSRLGEAIRSAIRKHEIVQQKNIAEKRLKESEEMYRSIVDHIPDAVIIHSKGKIIFANTVFVRLIGAGSFDDIRNKELSDFIHPEFKDVFHNEIARINEIRLPSGYYESRYISLKNGIIDVEVMGIPITYMGEPAIQTIVRDITERKAFEAELIKAKEKAEQSDRLKTAFLHNISHEIRTPMNAIVGFSALLNEPDLSGETQNSYLKIITDSSDQLLAIVNDIIEISNIEVGILKASYNEIDINNLLMLLYQQYTPRATEKGIELTLHTTLSGSKAVIETDSVKLNQILTNLLSNAFKFTRTGNISFGYKLEDDFLEFFVSDTGIGIQQDQFNKIFDRFYQVESSATRAYEGTGLGLSISKAYIELLGGKIWLSSQPGNGSVFYFTLPYVNKTQILSEMEKQSTSSAEKSVLIAEDDDNNFFLMKELLSDMNLKIIRASNGVEAVDAFKTGEKIDLVLMDIKMPMMDGYEAIRQILEKKPEARILAQTAYADDEVKAIESGCLGFISKPFIKDRFVSLVREYL